jgi:IPT/TIG domain-containing protein
MDAIRRTSTLRRVATTASLAALLIPAAAADAKAKRAQKKDKPPVITSVSPMQAAVGDELTLKGKNFRKGKGRNSVGFKRDGAPIVFVRSDVSTKKTMIVKLPSKLEDVMYGGTPARFSLRVLAERFGKRFTPARLSPTIRPRPAGGSTDPDSPGNPGDPDTPAFNPAGPEGDCDGDGVKNKNESGDLDNDLLSDSLEDDELGTDLCDADSDDDGVTDGYEYKSAVDLNDDEYQQPNTSLPYPGQRPYPNPLNADAGTDYDGDVLTLAEEHKLWVRLGGRDADETPQTFAAKHLSYSDGLQYSVYDRCPSAANPAGCGAGDGGRRVPTLAAAGYAKQQNFLSWANGTGYATVNLSDANEVWWAHVVKVPTDVRDVNRDGVVAAGCGLTGEDLYYDYDCDGYLSDDERDEDADGLTNYDESHGRMTPEYWATCYSKEVPFTVAYAGTGLTDVDSDGDGVRDGADDVDHDDLPNLMELSRMKASITPARPLGHNDTKNGQHCVANPALDPEIPNHPDDYGMVSPFNPCFPAVYSRSCTRHPVIGADPVPTWWSLQ